MRNHQKVAAILAAAFAIAVVATAAFAISIGMPLFPQTPASVAADTAPHFWKAGNIQDPKFQERYDELINKSRGTTQGSYSQDFLVIVHRHRHQAGWVLKGRLAELFPAGMSMILLSAFLVPLFETDKRVAENRGIDGMCLDIEGNIIATAGWELGGPGPMIYVFSPDGRVLELIQ